MGLPMSRPTTSAPRSGPAAEEIAACPWCGTSVRVGGPYDGKVFVVCDERAESGRCGAAGPWRDTDADAISAWNAVASRGGAREIGEAHSSGVLEGLQRARLAICGVKCKLEAIDRLIARFVHEDRAARSAAAGAEKEAR